MPTRRIMGAAVLLAATCLVPVARAQELPARALVADFVNASKDRHTMMARAATDAVALELTRRGVYEVVARGEVERAAKAHGMRLPLSADDLGLLAKELDAPLLVTGEIHHVDSRIRDRQREMEVGLIVRVRSVSLGEMVNGAAERGTAADPPDGSKTEGVLLMDAAVSAATRCVARIAAYRPIVGTILNTGTAIGDYVLMNRGYGHGVRARQEFLVFRDGVRVGRLRAGRISASDCELKIVENTGGIRPEDRAVAVFPEPKFGPR